MGNENKNDNEVGALWTRETKNGTEYFAGVVRVNGAEQKVVVFKNNYKKTEKQPDYNILAKSEGGQSSGSAHEQKVQAAEDVFGDDVPF